MVLRILTKDTYLRQGKGLSTHAKWSGKVEHAIHAVDKKQMDRHVTWQLYLATPVVPAPYLWFQVFRINLESYSHLCDKPVFYHLQNVYHWKANKIIYSHMLLYCVFCYCIALSGSLIRKSS